jgi:uncharacterized protein YodC (DUF2158 family)
MTTIKSGDLVVLKSGGPVMTVDTVNTDVLDDSKVTGALCVWFVGERLERVRFDYRALEHASLPVVAQQKKEVQEEATGDYKIVLDEMVAAMNISDADKEEREAIAERSKRISEAGAGHPGGASVAGD